MTPRVLLCSLPPSGGNLFPISLGYIAASLAHNSIASTIVEIDTVTAQTSRSFAECVLDFQPQVVGFSVYQASIRLALGLVKVVKEYTRCFRWPSGCRYACACPGEDACSRHPRQAGR